MSVRGLRRGRPKPPRTGGDTRSSSSTSWVTTTELRSVLTTRPAADEQLAHDRAEDRSQGVIAGSYARALDDI